MVENKSLDVPLRIIAALLGDIQMSHGEDLTPRAQRLTIQKIEKRCAREGIGFLTKTLPRLGKAFDRALLGELSLNSIELGFKPISNSQLPKFLGELFQRVFSHDGRILPDPCVKCIKDIRQLLYLFYKYELPHDQETEQRVLAKFIETEQDLSAVLLSLVRLRKEMDFKGHRSASQSNEDTPCKRLPSADGDESGCSRCWYYSQPSVQLQLALDGISVTTCNRYSTVHVRPTECFTTTGCNPGVVKHDNPILGANHGGIHDYSHNVGDLRQLTFQPWNAEWYNGRSLASPTTRLSNVEQVKLVTRARKLLAKLFASFDASDIYPQHGPGAVSTRERLWDKYKWTKISPRLITSYPLDTYFYVSLGHVCDKLDSLKGISLEESAARVVLVPKDSRGPRVISCEPLDFQWIQQGLRKALYQHIERHPLTRGSVRFTDQRPNQQAALTGSLDGGLATLDLAEASDRNSVELVRLLFPEPVQTALLNSRSLGTVLPNGKYIKLRKFAPMGSALCFPIMALAIWAILAAGEPDADARKSILVYGDDIVVQRARALDAIRQLESFGFKVNRDKSCYTGFFRESCGVDAYKGHDITPVKLKTVWHSSRRPDTYAAWIAYANSMHSRGYYNTYQSMVELLTNTYGEIPDRSFPKWVEPRLVAVPENYRPKTHRVHADYQVRQWKVWAIKSQPIHKEIDGWSMLLRYCVESGKPSPYGLNDSPRRCGVDLPLSMVDVDDLTRSPYSVRSYTKRETSKLVKRWR